MPLAGYSAPWVEFPGSDQLAPSSALPWPAFLVVPGLSLRDLARGAEPARIASAPTELGRAPRITELGPAVDTIPGGGDNGYGGIRYGSDDGIDTDFTLVWVGFAINIQFTGALIGRGRDGDGAGWNIQLGFAGNSQLDGSIVTTVPLAGYTASITGISAPNASMQRVALLRRGTLLRLYHWGSGRTAEITVPASTLRASTVGLGLGASSGDDQAGHHRHVMAAAYASALQDDEVWGLLANPFSALEPRRIWVPASVPVAPAPPGRFRVPNTATLTEMPTAGPIEVPGAVMAGVASMWGRDLVRNEVTLTGDVQASPIGAAVTQPRGVRQFNNSSGELPAHEYTVVAVVSEASRMLDGQTLIGGRNETAVRFAFDLVTGSGNRIGFRRFDDNGDAYGPLISPSVPDDGPMVVVGVATGPTSLRSYAGLVGTHAFPGVASSGGNTLVPMSGNATISIGSLNGGTLQQVTAAGARLSAYGVFPWAFSDAEARAAIENPWQLLTAGPPMQVVVGNLAALLPVSQDFSVDYFVRSQVDRDAQVTYPIREAVSADRQVSYAIRSVVERDGVVSYTLRSTASQDFLVTYSIGGALSPVVQDFVVSYPIRSLVSADRQVSYAIRSGVQRDSVVSYILRSPVSQDYVVTYSIGLALTPVVRDFPVSYVVRSIAQQDSAVNYAIRASLSSDNQVSYAIRTGVQRDAAVSYAVRSEVFRDVSATYAIRSHVIRDFTISYLIGDELPNYATRVAVIPADGRTVVITPRFNDNIVGPGGRRRDVTR